MSKKPATGRASIFRGKDDGKRVQGLLTKTGGEAFERRRRELQLLHRQVTGRKPNVVSDADVIEFLALGQEATTVYLERQ
jgi:hypothetical protein